METEAFQDLMDHSFYDCSTDGGSESGRNSIGSSEGRPEDQQYPDSSSSFYKNKDERKKTSKLQPVCWTGFMKYCSSLFLTVNVM